MSITSVKPKLTLIWQLIINQGKVRLECHGVVRRELVEELIIIQIHPLNLAKATKIDALLLVAT